MPCARGMASGYGLPFGDEEEGKRRGKCSFSIPSKVCGLPLLSVSRSYGVRTIVYTQRQAGEDLTIPARLTGRRHGRNDFLNDWSVVGEINLDR